VTLRILFVAAEATPFSKVGGLADVAGSLPGALSERGHEVRLVTPRHEGKPADGRSLATNFRGRQKPFSLENVSITRGAHAWLVSDDSYFPRESVYGLPDDLERYLFFSQVALQLPKLMSWQPDVVHLNDWHTGPIAYALRNYAWADHFYRNAVSVFTIHNLRYRGPDDFVDLIGPAIFYSDIVTTVSPTYAREILTREAGEGLHDLLRLRHDDLFGIVNGIDYGEFDPTRDPRIDVPFDADSLALRPRNASALRARLGLDDEAVPLVGTVTRLSEQKGIDIALEALELLAAERQVQAAILGAGDQPYEDAATALAARNPGRVSATIGFDAELAQQIYAGSDVFLMPSRFEPCGLGQMIAMRYGSIPIVRRTGGLADTVPDVSQEDGLGFVFDDYSAAAVVSALRRALALFDDRAAWQGLQRRAMLADFSWNASAARYETLYEQAMRDRGE
jgi:starch synthase